MSAERDLPTAVVRFAAMFSDWCEYAPLWVFLETWLGASWNRRVLGGRGRSAVPYLHVREACRALARLLELRRDLSRAEVVLVSPNGATSHEELFLAATARSPGRATRPWKVPKLLASVGIWARYQVGQARGRPPFERPWMGPMIDRRLEVDARGSQERLRWAPRERLGIVRRLPFLLENRRSAALPLGDAQPGSTPRRDARRPRSSPSALSGEGGRDLLGAHRRTARRAGSLAPRRRGHAPARPR